jgi:hypothetical protein
MGALSRRCTRKASRTSTTAWNRPRDVLGCVLRVRGDADGAIWLAADRCGLPRRHQAFHRAGLRDSEVSDAAVSRIPQLLSPLAVGLAGLP